MHMGGSGSGVSGGDDGAREMPNKAAASEQQGLLADDSDEAGANPFTMWNNYWSKPYSQSSFSDSDYDPNASFMERTQSVLSEHSTIAQERWFRAKESNWMQPFLVCTAMLGLCAVIYFGATASERGLDKAAGRPILRNMMTAGFCFCVADIIAQVIQHQGNFRESIREAQLGRSARASLLGMFLNGVGYSVWLYFLDKLIPQDDVGLHNVTYAFRLISKGCVDSYVWGILSNSVGIIGRRMLEGDRRSSAVRIWHSKIVAVTLMDFRFWPMWAIINFQVVPKKLQVAFVALGAIIWNIYMALVANWETTVHPRESHQRHPEGEGNQADKVKRQVRESYVGYNEIIPHVNEHSPAHPEFKLGRYTKGEKDRSRGGGGGLAGGTSPKGVGDSAVRGYQAV